jgi:hypothetical protein
MEITFRDFLYQMTVKPIELSAGAYRFLIVLESFEAKYEILCRFLESFISETDIQNTILNIKLFLRHVVSYQKGDSTQSDLDRLLLYELGGLQEGFLGEISDRNGDTPVKIYYDMQYKRTFLAFTDNTDVRFKIDLNNLLQLLEDWRVILKRLNFITE